MINQSIHIINGIDKNNFYKILKETYWGLHCRKNGEINSETLFHLKILIVFANNIGLINN